MISKSKNQYLQVNKISNKKINENNNGSPNINNQSNW